MPRRPPLVLIFTVTLTSVLNSALVTPAIPDILLDLNVPQDRSGQLVAAGAVAGLVVAPIIGLLADRIGRRIVLTGCLAIFGTFGIAAALAPTFSWLLAARLFQGLGSAGLVSLAIVLIGDHWSGRERTRLIGHNSAMFHVGLASIPIISGFITQFINWRAAFALYGLAVVIGFVTWSVLDEDRPVWPEGVRTQIGSVWIVLRSGTVLATMITTFLLFSMILGLFLTVYPIHLNNRFELEAGLRGVLIAVPAVLSIAAAVIVGRIRNLIPARTVVVIAAVGLGIGFLTLGSAETMILIIVASVVYGAAEGLLIPTLQDIAVHSSPPEHRGAVIAVWIGSVRLAAVVSPLVAGFALNTASTGTVLTTGSAVALLILLIGLFGPFSHASAEEPVR